MFAWIRSEIIRIELIVVSLSDNLCAQRGEVSQRETPPLSELSMPICTDGGQLQRRLTERLRLTSPLCVKCIAGKARFFTPGAESCQEVRGHACGHPARNCFDERLCHARLLLSRLIIRSLMA